MCEDDIAAGSPSSRDSVPSDSEQQNQPQTSAVDREAGTNDVVDPSHSSIAGRRKFSSGSLLQEYVLSPKKLVGNGDRYIFFISNSIFTRSKYLCFIVTWIELGLPLVHFSFSFHLSEMPEILFIALQNSAHNCAFF